MKDEMKLIEAVKALGELVKQQDPEIYILESNKEYLEKEVAEWKKLAGEHIQKDVSAWEELASKNLEKDEYIKTLEAKVYDLEERLAIYLGDNEGPMPMCEEFPRPGDVTEVTNITKVIEGVTE